METDDSVKCRRCDNRFVPNRPAHVICAACVLNVIMAPTPEEVESGEDGWIKEDAETCPKCGSPRIHRAYFAGNYLGRKCTPCERTRESAAITSENA